MLPTHFLGDTSALQSGDAAAAIIVAEDGRYLMQLRDDVPRIFYPGFWGCFGGAIAAGEEPLAALRRELCEELEYEPKDCAKILGFEFDLARVNDRISYRHYYLTRTTAMEVGQFVLHEGADMRLFGAAELFALPNVVPYDAFALWAYAARGRFGR